MPMLRHEVSFLFKATFESIGHPQITREGITSQNGLPLQPTGAEW
jgi:hypothetical protein